MMVKEYRYGICTWVHEVWFVKTAKGNAGIPSQVHVPGRWYGGRNTRKG